MECISPISSLSIFYSAACRRMDASKPGVSKLNFDGSLNLPAHLAGIKAAHQLEAELQAHLQGLKLSKTMAIRNLIMIEGDCLILVENLQRAGALSWEFMTLWKKLLQ